jgi:hypothetical protein
VQPRPAAQGTGRRRAGRPHAPRPPGVDPELDTAALHQIDALVEDLEGAGFDPLVDERELTVELTPCAHASLRHPIAQRCAACT